MTSLWLDRTPVSVPVTPDPGGEYDVVVVGAGLTGLVTALLFARAGSTVAVLEGRTIGAAATGNTTGKLSLLQGTHLSAITAKHSTATVRKYVDANLEGQQWLLRFCAENDIATQRADAITYAGTEAGTDSVRKEFRACERAGLDVAWSDDTALPFPTYGAVRLADQAQFDPMDVLEGLTLQACRHGATIFEHTRVHAVHGDTVSTDRGDIRAGTVVLATGTPILDRGGYFARLEPHRSYAAAFRVPGVFPHDMYLSADQPTRSLRYAPHDGEDLLLVGGSGHVVGRTRSEKAHVADMYTWTRTHFPDAELTHRWSAQDYSAIDELPYAGPLLPGSDHILVASGYAKWGMTNAVAAGLALAGTVLGGHQPWAQAYRTWRGSEVTGLVKAASMNLQVARHLTTGWLSAAFGGGGTPAEGEGRVERRGIRPAGVCTVDGTTSAVSPICPHLHGILNWNDAERSWDCPLHGSRFTHDGKLLEGPATRDLDQL
ncbi:FAD-dependent oxidoreductase [Nocardia nova]|uniref:FAD-dependent oxidoreductase n=1 Tax=Nocardia nova TaxID=37330 RepID=A0A2S6ABP5_9NOCA|nr:FAD-dependent oxidoreductase [Nocardia nova]MBV7706152.1 FAD-dependent oxidoreductase [Nocardia nova]PPJ31202.1 FAD-dependent oxidoreductase [Nocardia nova]